MELPIKIMFREATLCDVSEIAGLRTETWGSQDYWEKRVAGYMTGQIHPQQALLPRTLFIALYQELPVGFVAGHLTRRFDCQGEIEWIDTTITYRRNHIASRLLRLLMDWFIGQQAYRICVNVAADNDKARAFYKKLGAVPMDDHWMYWENISLLITEK